MRDLDQIHWRSAAAHHLYEIEEVARLLISGGAFHIIFSRWEIEDKIRAAPLIKPIEIVMVKNAGIIYDLGDAQRISKSNWRKLEEDKVRLGIEVCQRPFYSLTEIWEWATNTFPTVCFVCNGRSFEAFDPKSDISRWNIMHDMRQVIHRKASRETGIRIIGLTDKAPYFCETCARAYQSYVTKYRRLKLKLPRYEEMMPEERDVLQTEWFANVLQLRADIEIKKQEKAA